MTATADGEAPIVHRRSAGLITKPVESGVVPAPTLAKMVADGRTIADMCTTIGCSQEALIDQLSKEGLAELYQRVCAAKVPVPELPSTGTAEADVSGPQPFIMPEQPTPSPQATSPARGVRRRVQPAAVAAQPPAPGPAVVRVPPTVAPIATAPETSIQRYAALGRLYEIAQKAGSTVEAIVALVKEANI